MPRKGYGGPKPAILIEFRASELALLDRVCALTGGARSQLVRKGALELARRVLTALEKVEGVGQVAGGVPILQDALPSDLRAPDVRPLPPWQSAEDDHTTTEGPTDAASHSQTR